MRNVLVFLMIFYTGCTSNAQTKTMPAIRPTDLQFSYHYDGGMLYYMEDLIITRDSCVFTMNDGGKKTSRRFSLPATEMDAFYSMLLSNKFDQIESKEETGVYDRGGISMSASWGQGKKTLRVSDEQMSFVNEKWRNDWQRVVAYMTNLMQTKMNK